MPTADQIKEKRAKLRLTQAQAAAVVGISQRTWQQYELGLRLMNPEYWAVFTKNAKRSPKGTPERIKRRKIEVLSDIEAQCNKEHGCWFWTALLNPAGYPLASYQGKPTLVHRLAYQMQSPREIDGSLSVKRTCGNKTCVNPDHMTLEVR